MNGMRAFHTLLMVLLALLLLPFALTSIPGKDGYGFLGAGDECLLSLRCRFQLWLFPKARSGAWSRKDSGVKCQRSATCLALGAPCLPHARVIASAISAHDFYSGVLKEPFGKGFGLPIWQQVYGYPLLPDQSGSCQRKSGAETRSHPRPAREAWDEKCPRRHGAAAGACRGW